MTTARSRETGRTIRHEIFIEAPPERVWEAITSADEISRWFCNRTEVEPGAGGRIVLHWDQHMEWEMPISVWDPPSCLVLDDPSSSEGSAGRSPVPVQLRYELAGERGGTLLRLTHSGFGRESSWDGLYDGIDSGWNFELRSLQHYLHHHAGEDRMQLWIMIPSDLSAGKMREMMLGARGFGLQQPIGTLKEGDRFTMRPCGDESISGRFLTSMGATLFAGTVDQLDGGLLRLEAFECNPETPRQACIMLSAWGVAEPRVKALQGRWQRIMDELFGAASLARLHSR